MTAIAKIVGGAEENGKKVGEEGKVLASEFDSFNLIVDRLEARRLL